MFWRKSNDSLDTPNTMIERRKKRAQDSVRPNNLPDRRGSGSRVKKAEVSHAPEENVDLAIEEAFLDFVLIKDIADSHRSELVSEIKNVRKPHPILGSLISDITVPKALFDIVRTDPELVAKVINMANSALYGVSQPITTVNHAITYLGIVKVKNIAMHFALQKSVEFTSKQQQLIYQKIWSTSFLASNIALILAQELQMENAAELSTRCQLSYLGDISILFTHPKTAQLYKSNKGLLERLDKMQTLTDTNPAVVGALLAEHWELPASIAKSIEIGLLPLTNQLLDAQLDETEIKDSLICYCSKRLAEIIIFEERPDIIIAKSFSFADTQQIDFYYFESQLERAQFMKLSTLFASSAVKAKLQRALKITHEQLQ